MSSRIPRCWCAFPIFIGALTAGNSSQVSDGASAVLIVEERLAARLKLEARVRPSAISPYWAMIPFSCSRRSFPATRKLLKRAGLRTGDIDAFEVNEAFASVVLAWNREFDVDTSQLNRYGGSPLHSDIRRRIRRNV